MAFSADYLRSLLDYDPETGLFTWKFRPGHNVFNARWAGRVAGTPHEGYVRINLDGHIYFAHSLAWLHVYGEWSPSRLDHKDTIKNHNWISNLRPATHSQNIANQATRASSLSGAKGVYWYARTEKWVAKIRVNKRLIHLGYFDDVDQASSAYAAAAREAFGEFARAA